MNGASQLQGTAPTVERPRLREPGLVPFVPGLERYRVKGGGSLTVALAAGDAVRVTDPEGRQPCLVAAVLPDGTGDTGVLGLAANASDGEGRRVHRAFDDADSPPGAELAFTAQGVCTLAVAAPGGPMSPHDQAPPTDLKVTITRARVTETVAHPLPPPLAEPVFEARVDAATAIAYRVEAGQYLQIIDVSGRQCSDLQAFDARLLDKGIERPLDATTTRSLIGLGYPTPGLHAKYFDQDMQATLEVIQDTCGRHDTFGLACTARYYEDMGYFGHANCSENFNAALADYGVAPRKGWAAINLFFNTAIDEHNQYLVDEPWSRPGDHVLFRAGTDLVCASSSCPDDIDPANGWVPTDIHVRVYAANQSFQRAVAYRMTPDAEPQMTKETGFHPRTSALTRNFTEYRGYWLPTHFNNKGLEAEYWACREGVVAMDLSPLRKFEVNGPDAEELLQYTLTRNVKRLAAGGIVYTAMCNQTGGMLDDGTLFRLGQDNFRWIGGDHYGGIWLREQAEAHGWRVWVKSASDQIHNIAVQGPKSRDVLAEVVWTPPAQPAVAEIDWFKFTIGRIGGFHGIPVMVSRTGYTGELGYEVWCHPKDAPAVWDAVFAAGEAHDIAPLGLGALDVLRIESGLIFYGYEFDDQVDPFEAGIGFTVALKNDDDFIGRAALEKRKASPQRKLVGLELAGNEPAGHGDCVHVGRSQIGVVTSGCRSPLLGKNVALCRMAVEFADEGTEVEVGKIDGHQKRIPATVVRFPFYDPEKKRPRGME